MMTIAGALCLTTECISETGEFIFQRMVALKAPSSEFFRPTVTDQTLLIFRSLKKARIRITSQPLSNSHHFTENLAEPGRA
jgi:hypothetical protein